MKELSDQTSVLWLRGFVAPRFDVCLFVVFLALATSASRAQHNTDIWPGVSGTTLSWSSAGLIPGTVYNPLFRVDTFIHGWSNNDPGFDHTTIAVGDVAPLPPGVQVWLDVVHLDPAFVAIDNGFNVLDSPGDKTLLGGSTLHTHITWFIDETDPDFDPNQCVWEATFKFVDTGIGLADSPPFTFLFANVPVRGGEFPPTNTPASGDFDEDRDVDKTDFKAFATCMEGPGRRPAPDIPAITTCEVDCFNAFDFDDDMDQDLFDFAEFETRFRP